MHFNLQNYIGPKEVKVKEGELEIRQAIEEENLSQLAALIQEKRALLEERFGLALNTPLEIAIRQQKRDSIDCLLALGANPFNCNLKGRSPLEIAARWDDLSLFATFVKKLSLPKHRRTLEHFLMRHLISPYFHEEFKLQSLLVIEKITAFNDSIDLAKVLHYTLKKQLPPQILAQLLKHTDQKLLDIKNGEGTALIDLAARYGPPENVAQLLKAGATLNCNSDNRSTLFQAAIGNFPSLIPLLIAKGADLDKPEKSPDHDQMESMLHLTARRKTLPFLTALLQQGACTSIKGADERSPLHDAIVGGSLPAAKLLVQHGCQITAVDREGNNALHYALIHSGKLLWTESAALITWLVQLGLSPSQLNCQQQSALDLAEQMQVPESIWKELTVKEWR